MKLFTFLFFLFFAQVAMTQTETPPQYFAQCLFDISDPSEVAALEEKLRNHPNVRVVRLQYDLKYALLITQGLNDFSEADFKSWFGAHGDKLTCIQIGVDGIDTRNQYPFSDCKDK